MRDAGQQLHCSVYKNVYSQNKSKSKSLEGCLSGTDRSNTERSEIKSKTSSAHNKTDIISKIELIVPLSFEDKANSLLNESINKQETSFYSTKLHLKTLLSREFLDIIRKDKSFRLFQPAYEFQIPYYGKASIAITENSHFLLECSEELHYKIGLPCQKVARRRKEGQRVVVSLNLNCKNILPGTKMYRRMLDRFEECFPDTFDVYIASNLKDHEFASRGVDLQKIEVSQASVTKKYIKNVPELVPFYVNLLLEKNHPKTTAFDLHEYLSLLTLNCMDFDDFNDALSGVTNTNLISISVKSFFTSHTLHSILNGARKFIDDKNYLILSMKYVRIPPDRAFKSANSLCYPQGCSYVVTNTTELIYTMNLIPELF